MCAFSDTIFKRRVGKLKVFSHRRCTNVCIESRFSILVWGDTEPDSKRIQVGSPSADISGLLPFVQSLGNIASFPWWEHDLQEQNHQTQKAMWAVKNILPIPFFKYLLLSHQESSVGVWKVSNSSYVTSLPAIMSHDVHVLHFEIKCISTRTYPIKTNVSFEAIWSINSLNWSAQDIVKLLRAQIFIASSQSKNMKVT